jgi:hypothetical protein
LLPVLMPLIRGPVIILLFDLFKLQPEHQQRVTVLLRVALPGECKANPYQQHEAGSKTSSAPMADDVHGIRVKALANDLNGGGACNMPTMVASSAVFVRPKAIRMVSAMAGGITSLPSGRFRTRVWKG